MAKKKAKKKKGGLEVEYVPIERLRFYEGNPRKNDESVESIIKSIEVFGFVNPILVRRANYEIIAGHTRVKAMQALEQKEVPVIFLDLDETDAHVYNLFDNKSVENTDWDGLKLAEMFAELDELNVDLDLTGFSPDEIKNIVIGPTGIPEEPIGDMPESKYAIIIECKNEMEQQELITDFDDRGLNCRCVNR